MGRTARVDLRAGSPVERVLGREALYLDGFARRSTERVFPRVDVSQKTSALATTANRSPSRLFGRETFGLARPLIAVDGRERSSANFLEGFLAGARSFAGMARRAFVMSSVLVTGGFVLPGEPKIPGGSADGQAVPLQELNPLAIASDGKGLNLFRTADELMAAVRALYGDKNAGSTYDEWGGSKASWGSNQEVQMRTSSTLGTGDWSYSIIKVVKQGEARTLPSGAIVGHEVDYLIDMDGKVSRIVVLEQTYKFVTPEGLPPQKIVLDETILSETSPDGNSTPSLSSVVQEMTRLATLESPRPESLRGIMAVPVACQLAMGNLMMHLYTRGPVPFVIDRRPMKWTPELAALYQRFLTGGKDPDGAKSPGDSKFVYIDDDPARIGQDMRTAVGSNVTPQTIDDYLMSRMPKDVQAWLGEAFLRSITPEATDGYVRGVPRRQVIAYLQSAKAFYRAALNIALEARESLSGADHEALRHYVMKLEDRISWLNYLSDKYKYAGVGMDIKFVNERVALLIAFAPMVVTALREVLSRIEPRLRDEFLQSDGFHDGSLKREKREELFGKYIEDLLRRADGLSILSKALSREHVIIDFNVDEERPIWSNFISLTLFGEIIDALPAAYYRWKKEGDEIGQGNSASIEAENESGMSSRGRWTANINAHHGQYETAEGFFDYFGKATKMRVTRQEILDAAREAAANYAKILELVEAIAPQAPPGTISDKVKNKLKPFLDMIALFATAPGS